MKNIPIYKHDVVYARDHDEFAEWHTSFLTDVQCKDAIDAAIVKHFDGMRLSSEAPKEVIAAFGVERVAYVLANTVQCISATDIRIPVDNRKWANSILPVVPKHSQTFMILAHPGVLNIFIRLVRKEIENV